MDGHTLVVPDRRGNKRADTLHNLLRDDRLSFAALVPGRSGVLHVRGRASITDDPALLETLALRGMAPHAALLIVVEDADGFILTCVGCPLSKTTLEITEP